MIENDEHEGDPLGLRVKIVDTTLFPSYKMLGHQKEVLKAIAFTAKDDDFSLFEKEAKKSKDFLNDIHLAEFAKWIVETFSHIFSCLEEKVREWFDIDL